MSYPATKNNGLPWPAKDFICLGLPFSHDIACDLDAPFAGFGLGAGFFDNQESNTAKGSNGDGGQGFNVGGSYSFGPGSVSLMYQNSTDDLDGNNLEDEATIYHAGVTYTIADGLNAYGSYYNMSIDNEGGNTAANQNDAQVVIIGTRVTF